MLLRLPPVLVEWLEQRLRTVLERELPQCGISAGAQTLRGFWSMLAHGHGQVWNDSESNICRCNHLGCSETIEWA